MLGVLEHQFVVCACVQKSIHDTKTKTQAHLSVVESLTQPMKVTRILLRITTSCRDSRIHRQPNTQNLHQQLTAKELTAKLDKLLPTPSYFANINTDETKATTKKVRHHRHLVECVPTHMTHPHMYRKRKTKR